MTCSCVLHTLLEETRRLPWELLVAQAAGDSARGPLAGAGAAPDLSA